MKKKEVNEIFYRIVIGKVEPRARRLKHEWLVTYFSDGSHTLTKGKKIK